MILDAVFSDAGERDIHVKERERERERRKCVRKARRRRRQAEDEEASFKEGKGEERRVEERKGEKAAFIPLLDARKVSEKTGSRKKQATLQFIHSFP